MPIFSRQYFCLEDKSAENLWNTHTPSYTTKWWFIILLRWCCGAVMLNESPKGASTLCHSAHGHTARLAKVAPCHKYMCTLCRLGCGMLFDDAQVKIRSANCQSHQRKPRGIWWVKGFKMVSASLRKKSDKVHQFCSTVFLTRRSAKNFFLVDAIPLAAYAKQLLLRGKSALCCILPHGIVWTHLNNGSAATPEPRIMLLKSGVDGKVEWAAVVMWESIDTCTVLVISILKLI